MASSIATTLKSRQASGIMISILIGYDCEVSSRLVISMHRRTEQLYGKYKGHLNRMLGWVNPIGRRGDKCW